MKMIKYGLMMLFISMMSCKRNTSKVADEKQIVYSDEERVFVNFTKDRNLIIRNQLKENIIVNNYVIHTPTLTLVKEENGKIINLSSLSPPVPPENLSDYDTIIKPNGEIKIQMNGLIITDKSLSENEEIGACVDYRFENSEIYQTVCSDFVKKDNKYSKDVYK